MKINTEELDILTGPGVYTFSMADGEVVYVGATRNGLGRCLSPVHSVAQLFHARVLSLEFQPTTDEAMAYDLERQLIGRHNPCMNAGLMDGHRRYRARQRSAARRRQELGL